MADSQLWSSSERIELRLIFYQTAPVSSTRQTQWSCRPLLAPAEANLFLLFRLRSHITTETEPNPSTRTQQWLSALLGFELATFWTPAGNFTHQHRCQCNEDESPSQYHKRHDQLFRVLPRRCFDHRTRLCLLQINHTAGSERQRRMTQGEK